MWLCWIVVYALHHCWLNILCDEILRCIIYVYLLGRREGLYSCVCEKIGDRLHTPMCSYTLTHCLYLDSLCIYVVHVGYAPFPIFHNINNTLGNNFAKPTTLFQFPNIQRYAFQNIYFFKKSVFLHAFQKTNMTFWFFFRYNQLYTCTVIKRDNNSPTCIR